MPRSVDSKGDFSAGQLDETLHFDRSTALYKRGLKSAKNTRILSSRGISRRPGTRQIAVISEIRGEGFKAPDGVNYHILFAVGSFTVRNEAGGLVQTVTGCPWTADQVGQMNLFIRPPRIYCAHQAWMTKIISRATDGTWSIADFAFTLGPGNEVQQPYYPYAANTTLQPSALTGSISLVCSGAVFTTGHVGSIVRYADKGVLITSFVDASNLVGTVIDQLPPTIDLTVADATGFTVGQEVAGLDSGAKGIVTNVSGAVVTVLATMVGFTTEDLVGPRSVSAISGTAPATPAATDFWDEAAISAARGYPGTLAEHAKRLYLSDLPLIPNAIMGSQAGDLQNHDLGTGQDGEAIFEFCDTPGSQRVRHLVSAERFLIFTDRNVYFTPEDDSVGITPSTIEFRHVGEVGTGQPRPVRIEHGIAFSDIAGNRIMGILPTGAQNRPWELISLSEFWAELVNSPQQLAYLEGQQDFPERYIFGVNTGGQLFCLFYQKNGPNDDVAVGFTPWETLGTIVSVWNTGGQLYAIILRDLASTGLTYVMEKFELGRLLDSGFFFDTADGSLPLGTATGFILVTPSGMGLGVSSPAISVVAGDTVQIVRGEEYLGEYQVDAGGNIVDFEIDNLSDDPYEAGFGFQVDLELLPPTIETLDFIVGKDMRIYQALVRTHQTNRYACNGQRVPAYLAGEDMEQAPAKRNKTKAFTLVGWKPEPTVRLTQDFNEPASLTVLGVTQRVKY